MGRFKKNVNRANLLCMKTKINIVLQFSSVDKIDPRQFLV